MGSRRGAKAHPAEIESLPRRRATQPPMVVLNLAYVRAHHGGMIPIYSGSGKPNDLGAVSTPKTLPQGNKLEVDSAYREGTRPNSCCMPITG